MFDTPGKTHKTLASRNLAFKFKKADGRLRRAKHSSDEYNELAIAQHDIKTFKKTGQVIYAENGLGVRSFDRERLLEVRDLDTKEVLYTSGK